MAKVVRGYPPNYAAIKAAFNIAARPEVIFTYGDTIYVPSGTVLAPDLKAHEQTHIVQQAGMGAEAWWGKYIADGDFRLEQELEAYQAQWAYALKNYSRQWRRRLLKAISRDLAGPMYGKMLSPAEAEDLITDGAAVL